MPLFPSRRSARRIPDYDLIDNGDPEATGNENPLREDHSTRTAPVFTEDAYNALGPNVFPEKAVYGRLISQKLDASANVSQFIYPCVYVNTNAPFSAVVCGVQGSGKSHSTSVLLESCLMTDPRLGSLSEPLSGILFHFDSATGNGIAQPCEAAYLSSLHASRGSGAKPPEITVLVLSSSLRSMTRVYQGLPKVNVCPLHFAAEDISGERLLAMMKVDDATQMPLYMEAIMAVLRSMDSEDTFNYDSFRQKLSEQKFNPSQKAMLNIRLALLDSCLEGGNSRNRASNYFKKGHLTIVDLSSPYMDSTSACGFFNIILGLFIEANTGASGKIVVLDEAHKYLSENGGGSRLTEALLSVIRQQRHLGIRVVISTQEPTVVPPKFLELCSFIIAHRFSSPKWLQYLAKHVSAADSSMDKLLSEIISLRTGHAILFSSNALCACIPDSSTTVAVCYGPSRSSSKPDIVSLGQGYLIVRSRQRITCDGGQSVLAVQNLGEVSMPSHEIRLSDDFVADTLYRLGPSSMLEKTTTRDDLRTAYTAEMQSSMGPQNLREIQDNQEVSAGVGISDTDLCANGFSRKQHDSLVLPTMHEFSKNMLRYLTDQHMKGEDHVGMQQIQNHLQETYDAALSSQPLINMAELDLLSRNLMKVLDGSTLLCYIGCSASNFLNSDRQTSNTENLRTSVTKDPALQFENLTDTDHCPGDPVSPTLKHMAKQALSYIIEAHKNGENEINLEDVKAFLRDQGVAVTKNGMRRTRHELIERGFVREEMPHSGTVLLCYTSCSICASYPIPRGQPPQADSASEKNTPPPELSFTDKIKELIRIAISQNQLIQSWAYAGSSIESHSKDAPILSLVVLFSQTSDMIQDAERMCWDPDREIPLFQLGFDMVPEFEDASPHLIKPLEILAFTVGGTQDFQARIVDVYRDFKAL